MASSKEVRKFRVQACLLAEIKTFVETWHYSKNINGVNANYCFSLHDGDQLIGAMIYGRLGMANAWKKYGRTSEEVIELRRLCCIDDTPKNTESYFIGASLRYLTKHTKIKTIVSYADTYHGHIGTIYKASNFRHVGMTGTTRVIRLGDRQFHDKTIRTYYTNKNGIRTLKPFATKIKKALEDGTAEYETRPPKHIYVYELRR